MLGDSHWPVNLHSEAKQQQIKSSDICQSSIGYQTYLMIPSPIGWHHATPDVPKRLFSHMRWTNTETGTNYTSKLTLTALVSEQEQIEQNYTCPSDCSDLISSVSLLSPVEVDQSFGALLMMCGLCTVPNHGEHWSIGAVRRRRAGEEKGLSRSGVNGAVKGLCEKPPMERANTEAGVLNSMAGLGLIRSSGPEVTLRKKKKKKKG